MALLEKVRVLELINVLAGPFCCYQRAQLGAAVIKVEVPKTGDLARQLGADAALHRNLMGAAFLAQNAGKRSLTLNLKHDEGKEIFHRLVATAVSFAERGFAPPLCRGLFVLSRSVGALAHAWEESQSGARNKGPLPRQLLWTYRGPKPRRLKRDR